MKNLLIFTFAILCCYAPKANAAVKKKKKKAVKVVKTVAAPTVSLNNADTAYSISYKPGAPNFITVPVHIKRLTDYDTTKAVVSFECANVYAPVKPLILTGPITIGKETWAKSGSLDTSIDIKLGPASDTIRRDAFFMLRIANNSAGGNVIVRLSAYVPEKKAVDTNGRRYNLAKPGVVTFVPQEPVKVYSTQKVQVINARLKLHAPYADSFSLVKFSVDTGVMQSNPQIIGQTDSLLIPKYDWDAAMANDSVYTAHIRLRGTPLPDSVIDQQSNFISLAGQTGQSLEFVSVRLNPDKPFWVELGSNFDFLDNIKANNLYGGVFMHAKDVGKIFKRKNNPGNKDLSLVGGVYQSKSISSEVSFASNIPNIQYLSNSVFNPAAPGDSALVYRDTGAVTKSVSVSNLGLFFSPQIRLTKKQSLQNGFHVFASLWAEVVWQRVTTDFDYSKTAHYDMVHIPTAGSYSYKTLSYSADYRSHFFGLGLPMYLRYDSYNLYLNPVIGYSNQVGLRVNNTSDTGSKASADFFSNDQIIPKWRWFYLVQFRLSEERYGVAFTGEVRGVIANSGVYKPFISIALSKKFDLSKLIEFAK